MTEGMIRDDRKPRCATGCCYHQERDPLCRKFWARMIMMCCRRGLTDGTEVAGRAGGTDRDAKILHPLRDQ